MARLSVALTALALLAVTATAFVDPAQLPAPLAELHVPNTTAVTAPGAPPPPNTSDVSWGPPMVPRQFAGRWGVGTDETDCTEKDANRANVAVAPTRGFVAFRYALPRAAYVAFGLDVHAADSLANSFWAQLDAGSTSAFEYGTAKTTGWKADFVTHEGAGGVETQCFPLGAGAHTLRLYAREAGTAVAALRVHEVARPAVVGVRGCAPSCRRGGGDALTVRLTPFCGRSMLHARLVLVNGEPCAGLVQTGSDEVSCTIPKIVASAAKDSDNSLRLSLLIPSPPGASTPFDAIDTGVVLPVEPPEPFPIWASLIIVAIIAVAVFAAVYSAVIRPWLKVRHAPRDGAAGIGVSIVTLPDVRTFVAARLVDASDGAAQRAELAVCTAFRDAVRSAATRSGCYVFRPIGASAFAVAASDPARLVRFAAAMQRWAAKDARKLNAVVEAETDSKKADRANPYDADEAADIRAPTSVNTKQGTSNNRDGAADSDRVMLCVAIHAGAATVTEDAEHGTFDYSGPAVDDCAAVVDLCHPGQTIVSAPVIALARGGRDAEFEDSASGETRRLGASLARYTARRLSDDIDSRRPSAVDLTAALEEAEESLEVAAAFEDAGKTVLYTLLCSAADADGDAAKYSSPSDDPQGGGGGAMAAQLLQATTGGIASATATVLLVDTGVRLHSPRSLKRFQKSVTRLASIAERRGGALHAFDGSRIIFTFNARTPVIGHRRKAALAALDMRGHQHNGSSKRGARQHGGSWRSATSTRCYGALATGRLCFGSVAGADGAVAIFGPALDAARELVSRLEGLAVTMARDPSATALHAPGRRGAPTVATSGEHHPLYVDADPSSAHCSGSGEEGSADHSDSSQTSDSSAHGRSLTSSAVSSVAAGAWGSAGLPSAAARVLTRCTPRFVCDGAAYVDLGAAFEMAVLDVPAAANAAHGSATPAQKPTRTLPVRDAVALAGIVGLREMAEDEEWNYDLAAKENASPTETVSAAFIALANCDADAAARHAEPLGRVKPPAALRLSTWRVTQLLRQLSGDA